MSRLKDEELFPIKETDHEGIHSEPHNTSTITEGDDHDLFPPRFNHHSNLRRKSSNSTMNTLRLTKSRTGATVASTFVMEDEEEEHKPTSNGSYSFESARPKSETSSSTSSFNSYSDDLDSISISSSVVPISITSSTIKQLIEAVPDKLRLKEELNGFKSRNYFTNMFASSLQEQLSHRNNNNNTVEEDDFQKYDRLIRLENYLRQKTRKHVQTHGNVLGKSYTIDILRGDPDIHGRFVAGNEDNMNKSNFKMLRFGKIGRKKIKTTNSSTIATPQHDSVFLQNFKSLETNDIDRDFNYTYNIPIDHQNYNNLVSRLDRHEPILMEHDMGTGKRFKDSFVDIEQIDSLESNIFNNNHTNSNPSKMWWFHKPSSGINYEIQRKLGTRHLTMILFGGTLGVGLFLASGKLFSIAGPLGTLLGFAITGSTVLLTMLSFCEMVTLIPLAGGVSGISSRFVEDLFGFLLGISYLFNYMIGLPTEITLLTIMLSYYDTLKIPGPSTAGFVTLFLVLIIGINLCDVRLYGEIEYYSSVLKLFILFLLIIFNIVLNVGGVAPYHKHIGFKYWDSLRSDLASKITYGPFRPTFDVNDTGLGSLNGIPGAKGRFLAVLIAAVIALYCFIGTEILLIAGGELKNPRKLIPKSSKLIYWRILLFYIVGIFVISLNIYSGDPRLLRYYGSKSVETSVANEQVLKDKIIQLNGGTICDATLLQWAGFANGNQSPWVILLQSAGLCGFSGLLNGFLVYFALTAGSSQLYLSSRTCYYLSIQGKLPKFFLICSRHGVPYVSVLFTGAVGSLLYLTVNNNTLTVFQKFLSVCSSFGLVVWGGMNLAFIRFYYGLRLRPDIIGRDDTNYPYKSPFQPYLLYYGLISSVLLVLMNGLVVFLKGNWSISSFFTSYGSLFLFVICYVSYKIIRRTKVHRLDQLDLDSGRREIDRIIWEDNRTYNHSFKELFKKGVSFVL